MKNSHFLLVIACCLSGFVYGQQEAHAIFSAKVNNVRSFGEACGDGIFAPEREYTAYVGLNTADAAGTIDTFSSGCIKADCNGGCSYGQNTPLFTDFNTSAPNFVTYLEAWEDDEGYYSTTRCTFDAGDDCHVTPASSGYTVNVDLKSLFSPNNGTYNNTPEYGGNANHAWTLDITWKYSDKTVGNADIPALDPPQCFTQNITAQAGSIRAWVVDLKPGENYIFETISGLDTYLRLYAPDGFTQVAEDDDTGNGYFSMISYTPTQGGRYFIEVSEKINGSTRHPLTVNATLTRPGATPVIYVKKSATGGNNGTSWANAYTHLQTAISTAAACGINEIWVAAGTYYPDEGFGLTIGDRDASFAMHNNLSILGGFPNGGNPGLGQRDWINNPTILSGDIGVASDTSDNSKHVVKNANNGLNNTALLDGFTITGGKGLYGAGMYNENASPSVANCHFTYNIGVAKGGGMYNLNASPDVSQCIFSYNQAEVLSNYDTPGGGGMYNGNLSAPTVTNCVFESNSAIGNANIWEGGGGMLNDAGSSATVSYTEFYYNSGQNGGGMLNYRCSPEVIECIFAYNSATSAGGGMFNYKASPPLTSCDFISNSASDGGGMSNGQSSSTLTSCTFTSNSANNGGGMDNHQSSITLTSCTFTSNSANYGGGIYNAEGVLASTLTNCVFISNSAALYGGGFFNGSGNGTNESLIISGCTFKANTASSGGGIDHNSSSSIVVRNSIFDSNSGRGMRAYGEHTDVVNCTFYGNSGSGIYTNPKTANLTNNIFWGNSTQITGSNAVTYSIVQGGYPGLGNLNLDPVFVDPSNGDFHLQNCSFAIDAGTATGAPATDLDGNPRPANAGYDMGAYEFQGTPAQGYTCYLDADGDGHGNPDQMKGFCTPCGNGYVSSNDDCDDTDPAIFPGSPEICDGIDNDCNGFIDDAQSCGTPGLRTWVGDWWDNNWNTACNWAPPCVPTADDDVVIPAAPNNPVISTGVAAKSVWVKSGAQLTLNPGTTLTINGSLPSNGIQKAFYNEGTVENNGAITVTSIGSIGVKKGIQNDGVFNNNTNGDIHVDWVYLEALLNNSGTFTNAGNISIGAAQVINYWGISNNAIFHNSSTGQIHIDRTTAGALLNSGTFNNDASIIIGGLDNVGTTALYNAGGTFHNNSAGNLEIDGFTSRGLLNSETSGTLFSNAGNMSIGTGAGTGLIGITNAYSPLYGGTGATFNNEACGTLTILARFQNNAVFNTAGLLTVNTAGAHTNTALTNNGIIEYPQGNPLPNVTNNDVIAAPYTGGCPVANALQLGASVSFTVGTTWYLDQGLTQSAGTYDQNTNVFTASNVPNGVPTTVYFNVNDDANNCTGVVSKLLTLNCCVAPTFTACPTSGVNVNTPSNACAAAANYTVTADGSPAPVFTYACTGATTGSGSGTGSGNSFNTGVTNVVVTATNNCGAATCTFSITVVDNVAPTALCQNVTVQLNAAGSGSTTAAAVNNGSSDACGIAALALNTTSFTCANIGANTVTLTVTDVNSNTSTCTATVTVQDNVAPTALCQNVTVQLNAAGSGSTAAAAVNNGSSDACGIAALALNTTSFTCANIGANTVTLTVTDVNSNINTCTATVTVQDNVAPTALCQDVTVSLNAAGSGSTTAAAVNSGSSDACGIATMALSNTSFTCANIGANTVTFTVTDVNSNTSTCTATVTVQDNVAPTALCQDVTVSLNAAGNGSTAAAAVNNGSSDACGIAALALNTTSFTCANIGANTVTFTVTDVNSNTSTCSATVTVQDNVAPVAICQDVIVALDVSGNGAITTADVDNGSNDACGIATMTLSNTSFTCANIGANTVTLTVTDVNSNTSTCTATVTVQDNVVPAAVCQDVIVALDASGNGATTTADVDNGSNDACGIASLSLDDEAFTCADVSGQVVTLTVTDNNGNSSTCTANVTVQDNVAPVASCQDAIVALDASGNGAITTADVDNGSNDACGIASLSLDDDAFTCADVSGQVVTLTVTDNNGNSSTCTANVTVQDHVAPVAVCQDVTVTLDASGNGSTSAAAVDNGSSDACGVQSYLLSAATFTCAQVGRNVVTLIVTDNNANTSTCTAVVTVNDIPPAAICQDVTVTLDAAGDGSTTEVAVNNGSSDACGIASLTLDNTLFDCTNLGSGNTVILTVTDINGNSSTCSATVAVNDVTPPVVTTSLINLGGGDFEVDFAVSDVCDPSPTVVSVMETPGMTGPTLTYKVKNKKKLIFDTGLNTVKVEAPDPQAFWAAVLSAGGVSVFDGLVLQLEDDPGAVYQYDFQNNGDLKGITGPAMTLRCTATDASGNSATATAAPVFVGNLVGSPGAGPKLLHKANSSAFNSRSTGLSNDLPGTDLGVFPNPFSTSTTIRFDLQQPQRVQLAVFNLQGQRVRLLLSAELDAGVHEVRWDEKSGAGATLESGLYLIRLRAGDKILTKRVSLMW